MSLLDESDGLLLLGLARSAIAQAVGAGESELALALARALDREPLRRMGAAFVTLHLGSELRGCIGTLEMTAPLARSVARHAVAAALEDPRFAPLPARELPAVRLTVSVLGPLTPVPSPEAIVLGRHGVSLVHGIFRSVFLPEVAGEQGWDVPALLENLAVKAGLGHEAWRDASLAAFETVAFTEPVY